MAAIVVDLGKQATFVTVTYGYTDPALEGTGAKPNKLTITNEGNLIKEITDLTEADSVTVQSDDDVAAQIDIDGAPITGGLTINTGSQNDTVVVHAQGAPALNTGAGDDQLFVFNSVAPLASAASAVKTGAGTDVILLSLLDDFWASSAAGTPVSVYMPSETEHLALTINGKASTQDLSVFGNGLSNFINVYNTNGTDGVSVFGGAGDDTIGYLQPLADQVDQDTRLDGGSGNDLLRVKGGRRVLFAGGTGKDTVEIDRNDDTDTFNLTLRDNTLGVGGYNGLDEDSEPMADHFERDLEVFKFELKDVALALGSSRNEEFYVNGGPAGIFTGGGNDIVSVTGGDASIVGGRPLGGSEDVFGGVLAFQFGNGVDEAQGNDRFTVRNGNLIAYGGLGNDNIDADASGDSILGGDGNDTIRGRGGDDYIVGGAGNDCILGDDGNDTIDGEDGNDVLKGMAGNDSIVGGIGNDSLDGGTGTDFMDGGDGDDFFQNWDGETDTIVGGAGNDSWRGGNQDVLNDAPEVIV